MRRFDLTPLYRSTVGFDHLASILDQLASNDSDNGFPPYNIERLGENEYRITLAVAGFSLDDLSIDMKEGTLTVRGEKKVQEKDREYLHRGIAARNFERRFRLADHVEATGAALENGFLHVDLKRELPEAMKPRVIPINKSAAVKNGAPTIEGEAEKVRLSA
jgi:molecular chaperone IbpA